MANKFENTVSHPDNEVFRNLGLGDISHREYYYLKVIDVNEIIK